MSSSLGGNPRGGWVLPANPEPSDTVCVQLAVPNDPAYIEAFWGAILDLSTAWLWANDSGHTAIRAARRMRKMYYDALDHCPPPIPCPDVGACGDDCDVQIRQNPTNPCILEMMCNGTWVQWADLSLCNGTNQNPPPGVTPPTGQCSTFNATLHANERLLMPFVANSTDVITLMSAQGASNDGSSVDWHCNDGQLFFAGACLGGKATQSGDPLNTAPHGTILIHINGVYYDFSAGPVTVPSGVTNAQVYLQMNYQTILNASGEFKISVQDCNNGGSALPGVVEFDFTTDQQGFVDMVWNGVTGGIYSPGNGWGNAYPADTALSDPVRLMTRNSVITGGVVHIKNNSTTQPMSDCKLVTTTALSNGYTNIQNQTLQIPAGTQGDVTWQSSPFPVNVVAGQYLGVWATNFGAPAAAGLFYITHLKLFYTGSNPFG